MAGTLVSSLANQLSSIDVVVAFFAVLAASMQIGRWMASQVDNDNPIPGRMAITKSSWALLLLSSNKTFLVKLFVIVQCARIIPPLPSCHHSTIYDNHPLQIR
jgi:hypothetical protein